MTKSNEKQCFICKKRPVWRGKKGIVHNVCKRCYHKEGRIGSKKTEDQSMHEIFAFSCLKCQEACTRDLFENEKEICCLCDSKNSIFGQCYGCRSIGLPLKMVSKNSPT